jgi:hypothetical protein
VSRDSGSETDDVSTTAPPASYDVFRQFFESKFQPLNPVNGRTPSSVQEESTGKYSEEESEAEWQGITDEDEDEHRVEIIEHTDVQDTTEASLDKKTWKAFMVSSTGIHRSPSYFDANLSFCRRPRSLPPYPIPQLLEILNLRKLKKMTKTRQWTQKT